MISCTGNYARETGRMVGLELPVVPVEHQYIVTGAIPELAEYNQGGILNWRCFVKAMPPTICVRKLMD